MMKKEKVKKVVLKNPHLRNLRRNLRIILQLKYDEMAKYYINQKMSLLNGRKEFERTWDPIMRKIRDFFPKSTLGCSARGDCLIYQALVDEKKRKNLPKQNQKFSTIAPSLHEYLTVEELMDVDLVWVSDDGLGRWICTKCYQRYKLLRDSPDWEESIDS